VHARPASEHRLGRSLAYAKIGGFDLLMGVSVEII
jgi:hypothetical protein